MVTTPPVTDEALQAIREAVDTTPAPGPALSWAEEARLLTAAEWWKAEADRLRAELATVSDEAGVQCREAAARTNEARRERNALAAKLAAVEKVIEPSDWKPISERHPEYFKPDTPEEAARKKGWKQGVDLLTQQLRAALGETGGTDER